MFLKDKLASLLSSLSHRCPPSSWYLCATKIKCATQTVRVVFKPGEKQTQFVYCHKLCKKVSQSHMILDNG